MISPADFSKSLIALACWRAAKTELHQVMLSVCMVFMNRAKSGWYDGDVYENAIRWLAENPGEYPDIRDPQFQLLLTKLDSVTSGMVPDKTDGALYFVPKNLWENWDAKGYKQTTSIGNLVFLK